MNEKSVYAFGNQIGLQMLIYVSRVRSQVASRVTWQSHERVELWFLLVAATTHECVGQQEVDYERGFGRIN
jgi:hypothetical protein